MILRSAFSKNVVTILISIFIKRVKCPLLRIDSSQRLLSRPRWQPKCKFQKCSERPSTKVTRNFMGLILNKLNYLSKSIQLSAHFLLVESLDLYLLSYQIQSLLHVMERFWFLKKQLEMCVRSSKELNILSVNC